MAARSIVRISAGNLGGAACRTRLHKPALLGRDIPMGHAPRVGRGSKKPFLGARFIAHFLLAIRNIEVL